MQKIVLISCASRKTSGKAKARDLYASALFKLNLKYAESLKPDKIFVLSAKHGVIGLEEEIEPYEQTLNNMQDSEIREWTGNVVRQLSKVADLEKDGFVLLAGERYRKYLTPHLQNYKIPLQGLGIGKQLKKLKEFCNE